MGEKSVLTVFVVITDNRIEGGRYKLEPQRMSSHPIIFLVG